MLPITYASEKPPTTTKIKPNLTGPQETLLAILEARAIDARAKHPVLGDQHAASILSRLDYDFAKMRISRSRAAVFAVRARALDRYAADFLRRARPGERVTVLHLAAGLDTRALRMRDVCSAGGGGGDGPDVLWVDVDLPDVVDVRRRLEVPGPEASKGEGEGGMRYELRAADVTREGWLGELGVPKDRRTLVLFEGLSMYLTPEAGRALIETVTGYFVAPRNQLAFDCIGWFGVKMQRLEPITTKTNSRFYWAVDEPRDVEQWHRGLKLQEVVLPADDTARSELPAMLCCFVQLMACVPPLRKSAKCVLYEW